MLIYDYWLKQGYKNNVMTFSFAAEFYISYADMHTGIQ